MTERIRLPQRRRCWTTTLEHDGRPYEVSVGFYDDGRPGEVFINTGKTPEAIHQHAADAAVAISIGLQHGVPAGAFKQSMPRHDAGGYYTVIGCVADMLAAQPWTVTA